MTTPSEPVPRPRQFALWHIFALILVVAIVLALVTQLRHVGLVAAVFVTGGAAGLWRRDWRLVAASGTALAIYVVTYFACWLQLGYDATMEHHTRSAARFALEHLQWMVRHYADDNGELPKTLADAAKHAGNPTFLVDPWGNDFRYRRTERGFEISSFGRDGRPGGTGLDADLAVTSDYEWVLERGRLPLGQFLFDSQGSRELFIVATLASIISAAIWYRAQERERPSARWLATSLIVTFVFSVIVAILLAAFYIMASQSSGH